MASLYSVSSRKAFAQKLFFQTNMHNFPPGAPNRITYKLPVVVPTAGYELQSDPNEISRGLDGNLVRGIILSSQVQVTNESFKITGGEIDPQELRCALLLWDRLVWPTSDRIKIGSTDGLELLIDSGNLHRPVVKILGGGSLQDLLVQSHLHAYNVLDRTSPGHWSLARGPKGFDYQPGNLGTEKNIQLELLRSIPVPDFDVPFEEILNFKLKRSDELGRLRAEIDQLTSHIQNAESPVIALNAGKASIENACLDLIKAGKGWKFPVRIIDLKMSLDFNLGQVFMAGASAAAFQLASPLISAAVGGALATIKITGPIHRQKVIPRSTPYDYVYNFHKDLF